MGRVYYRTEDIIQHLRTWELEQAKGGSKEEAARRVGINYQMLCRLKKEYGDLLLFQLIGLLIGCKEMTAVGF